MCFMNSIGFFDSGVGGISVLRQAIKEMPEENYIYYGDNANAPYGNKDPKEIHSLTMAAVEHLVSKDQSVGNSLQYRNQYSHQ